LVGVDGVWNIPVIKPVAGVCGVAPKHKRTMPGLDCTKTAEDGIPLVAIEGRDASTGCKRSSHVGSNPSKG
jgi:hypothetical protein